MRKSVRVCQTTADAGRSHQERRNKCVSYRELVRPRLSSLLLPSVNGCTSKQVSGRAAGSLHEPLGCCSSRSPSCCLGLRHPESRSGLHRFLQQSCRGFFPRCSTVLQYTVSNRSVEGLLLVSVGQYNGQHRDPQSPYMH